MAREGRGTDNGGVSQEAVLHGALGAGSGVWLLGSPHRTLLSPRPQLHLSTCHTGLEAGPARLVA